MSVDVVCAGAPFLDITFSGMGAMPALGEERMAERVQFTPGGLANVALGLTRLDLEAVVVSPVGDDLCGRILSGLLAEQGIGWVGPRADATAVSAILPLDGDRAFVTVAPDLPHDGAAIAALGPLAVVIDLPEVAEVPPGCAAYAVVGDCDARALAGRLPAALAMARTLVANHSEASFLTGIDDPGQAAEALTRHCPTVVVTLADEGAICAGSHGLLRQSAPSVTAVDTNGAGDLFTAAWVWADLAGMPVGERLRLAVTYAAMSVRVPTTLAGALTIDEFRDIAGPFDASIPPNGAR
jgi:sugar/nucleoside kinase (ribokinase family)